MSVYVRPYDWKDRDRVRLICIATSDIKVRSESKRQYILSLYCDYYIEKEPESCFVAVDKNDETGEETVVGYILATCDCERYVKGFMKDYMPKIKHISKLLAFTAKGEAYVYSRYATFFPAHLHIDILPEYRRMGVGTALINALKELLTQKRIKGVMLIVGVKNQAGISFYKKCGFSSLGKIGQGFAMGLDL
ncbi:MAG: GNAT family N-acetyltransferase [Clostridiales bacterium]|nr:GNAT family N-acetyltransferase [Clostridiales bacterium]